MMTVFSDGRWHVVLAVSRALGAAGLQTSTDTKGRSGKYSVAVDMREGVAARRIIAALDLDRVPMCNY